MNNFCMTILCGVSIFGLAACSSDTPAAGSNNGDGSAGAAGSAGTPGVDVLPDGGCPDPSKQVFDGKKSCVTREEAVAQCKTQAAAQSPGSPTDQATCGAGCTCTECPSEMLSCGNDLDDNGYCATILKCAQDHNCTGVACYQDATCKSVIDAAPNGGIQSYSVALAGAVSDCATKNGAIYMGRTGNTCAAACP